MNNPPYQPYGGPPAQPNVRPQQQQQQQAPLSNSFRPFNPAAQQQQQMSAPYQQQQQQFPPRQGPPSASGQPGGHFGAPQGAPGGMNIRPPQMMAGGPPRGFSGPPSGGPPAMGGYLGGPQSQPGGVPPPQFNAPPGQFNAPPQGVGAPAPGFPGRAGAPMSQPSGFQPGGPAGLNRGPPTMMSGPPSAGAVSMARGPPGPGGMQQLGGPPQGMGLRGPPTGPPTGPMTGPPPNANGLNAQFSQMGLGAPPAAGAPLMGGPPGPSAGPPPPMGAGGVAPGMGGPMRSGPPGPGGYNAAPPPVGGQPMMNQQQPAPPGPNYVAPPSGNFQQPADMMDGGYNQQGQPMQQSPISDELMASQCEPRFMRMSVNAIPHSQDHANKSNITIGVVIRPLAPPEDNEELDVVNFGPSGVVRCRHCRTYVNPFVQWVDNGRRWRCNLCGVSNDVASSYFCHLNANQQRQDRAERPELNTGSVEIVAPSEYMMRPPQPPCYMFVIDVSATAVSSGAVQLAVQTIREQLDNLPGAPRTRVGFVTYDSSIHFYNLKSTLKAPQMMVIADLDELFIPIPDELLVNLSDSREVIETLLDSLPTIHQNARSAETAMGPAIRVAFKLMSSIGGKMLVFQSALPSTGQGALRNRENPRLIGTDKEQTLLNPIDTFYRSNAIDFCRQQVSVDTFLFSSQYQDVATIGSLSRFSAGQVYYYPAFTVEKDGEKFKRELTHCLVRETGWEAVMRVRCTKGMRLTNFYGNLFLRGPDLLALPTCHADSTFAIEITHSDALLSSTTISVQAALLYTNSGGERRIRVHTMCIPVTKLFAEVFRSVDVDTLCNIMAKNALEVALKTGLDSARTRLQNQCADIVRAYRNSGAYGANKQGGGYQIQLPESLQLLPLYVMSLLKNSALRGGTDLNPDERVFCQYQLNNMPVPDSRVFIYPRMFALANMPPEAGLPLPEDQALIQQEKPIAGSSRIALPPVINLSIERLQCDGVFLLEDSVTLYMWVGRSAPPAFLTSLFGFPTMDGVDCKQVKLLAPHDDISRRVDNILTAIREDRRPLMNLVVMREGDPTEGRFFWKLVEDRASFNGGSYSYAEYLGQISRLSLSGDGGDAGRLRLVGVGGPNGGSFDTRAEPLGHSLNPLSRITTERVLPAAAGDSSVRGMVMSMSISYFTAAGLIARAKRYKQRCVGGAMKKVTKENDDLRSTSGTDCYCETPTNDGRSSSGVSTLYSPTFSNTAASSQISSTLPQNLRLHGWMYWARYEQVPERQSQHHSVEEYNELPKKHQTVMKVYAVLRNEFLLLYRDSWKSSRHNSAPLIQIAVERAGRSIDGAFHVFDPHGEEMELHLYDRQDEEVARQWEVALEQAAEFTHSYFARFELKVEELPRRSMYRGTLHDFRSQQRPSFRQSTHAKLKLLASLPSFRPSQIFESRTPTSWR